MAKLADVTDFISFLEEQLKSIKEKILQVEEAIEQLIATSCSLCTNYLLLRSIKGVGIINAIVYRVVQLPFGSFPPLRTVHDSFPSYGSQAALNLFDQAGS